MARQYSTIPDKEAAAEYARKVIDQFPNSPEAEEAKALLQKIKN